MTGKIKNNELNWLNDPLSDQELVNPVTDARMVLAEWSEQRVREKASLAKTYFTKWHRSITQAAFDDDRLDSLDLLGLLDIAGSILDKNHKSLGVTLEELVSVYILSEAFSGNSSSALMGAYYLAKFESIRYEQKYYDEVNRRDTKKSRNTHASRMDGRKSGKIRKEDADSDTKNIIDEANRLIDSGMHKRNIVSKIYNNQKKFPFSKSKIRKALTGYCN